MNIIENFETTTNPLTINTTNLNNLNTNSEINDENEDKQNFEGTVTNIQNNENNTSSLNNIDSEDNPLSPSTFANLSSSSSSQTLNNINSYDNSNSNNDDLKQNININEDNNIIINNDHSICQCTFPISNTKINNSNEYTYHLYNLPNEILIQIGSLIDIKSLGRICQVSKLLYSVFYSAEELWENLNLSKKNTIGGGKYDNDFPILDNLEFLLNNPKRNRRFYSLKKIDLSITVIDDLSIFEKEEVLNCCSKLRRINLTSCKHIDAFSIYYLKKLPNLDSLDLCYCDQINDLSLKIISDYLPHLKYLDLSYLSNITEEGLRHLLKLPELETVKVLGCFHIRSYFWSYLGDFRNRGILPIRKLVIGEHGKSQFRLPKFCVWRMNDLVNYCPLLETLCLDMVLIDWTNNSLKTLLDGCTKLKELSLLLYDNAWASFVESSQCLEKLEKLELTLHCGLSITESTIDQICKPNVTSIRFLQKASIYDSNEIISKIESRCKKIQSIEMNATDLNNIGIEKLHHLKGTLLELSLYEPTVTNKLLNAISEMKLKDLNLTDMKKANFSNQFKKLFRGNKIKNKTKNLIYDPIESAKISETNFKNKIVKGKKTINHLYNPIKEYEGTILSHSIVELELNSKEYFQDSDLQNIGIYCTSLRWISLSFPNTYPKTICSLINCPELIIVQLTVSQPFQNSLFNGDDDDNHNDDHEVNSRLRIPNNDNNNNNNYNSNNNSNNNNNNNNNNGRHGNNTIEDRRSSNNHSNQIKRSSIPLNYFKASSPECQSLVKLSQYGKKIRFLQLCGPIGLTDYSLGHMTNLVSLNTIWIKDCNDFTFDGLYKFSEAKWKTLKRLIVTDCKNVKENYHQKVHILKDLEIDLIIENKD